MTAPTPEPRETRCPTCGSRVEIHTGDEGTSHYIPIVAPYPDEVEALTEPLGELRPWDEIKKAAGLE